MRILIVLIVLIINCLGFERIFFKEFTQPDNTQNKNLNWMVADENFNDIDIKDFLNCNGE